MTHSNFTIETPRLILRRWTENDSFATEALQALIQFCRNTLHLQSVILKIDARNTASRKVAGKCAFTPIGEYTLDGVPTLAFRLVLS